MTKSAGKGKPGRKPGGGESISGYFRKIFNENPGLLDSKSNEALLQRWLQDHPDQKTVPENVKGNLANVKSIMRKASRKQNRAAKKAAKANGTKPAATSAATGHVAVSHRSLDSLEERIDDCLTVARIMDPEGLDSVIRLLRRARNEVVWKIGQ